MEQGFDHIIRMMPGDDPRGSMRLGDRLQMAMPRVAHSLLAGVGRNATLVREPDYFAGEIPAMGQAVNEFTVAIALGTSEPVIDVGDH